MEMTSAENSEPSSFSSNAMDHPENLVPHPLNHRDVERKHEISSEEVRDILEVIATTGKFWHDWDTLKSLLSLQLMQVLAEYPEAKMASDQQSSLLGETHSELAKRLDEALLSFIEGPPFTLQRLCEILLTARSIYPNLSKLALALEKNLSVTSTLSICNDPYPSTMILKPDESNKESEGLQAHSTQVQNGVEVMEADGDEEMTQADEVEEDTKEVEEDTKEVEEHNKDTELEAAGEMITETSETNSELSANTEPSALSANSEPSAESSPIEQHSAPSS